MKKKLLSRAAVAALLSLPFSPAQVHAAGRDLDGDGIPNIVDPDIDNDGIPNALDRNVDGGVAKTGPFAGQQIGDNLDNDNPAEKDIDDDGQADDSLGESDIDGDGKRDDDSLETDTDGDKRADDHPSESDLDGDGRRNDDDRDFDIDGDGLDDDDNSEMDIDGDNRDDDSDDDIDGDNRGNGDAAEDDTDGDGRKDDSADEGNDDGDRLDDRMDSDDDNDGSDDNEDSDHRHEDDEQEVQISLTKQSAAPSGSRVRVKIQQMATGKVELELDGRDLPAGGYDVTVDGTLIGQLTFIADGNESEAEQEWETGADAGEDEIDLTIPVIGKPITVSRGGVVYFSGTVPTPPPATGGGGGTPTPAAGDLIVSSAAPAGANGKVEVEFRTAGMHSLEIEFEDIAAGTYTLTIGDTARGSATVAAGGQGRFKFEVAPEASEGELPLDFPAAGLPVTISLDGVVIFTGTVPAAPPGVGDGGDDNGDDNGGGTPIVSQLTRGAAAPAVSKAEIQVQFGAAGAVGVEVEAEDLPAGDYTFSVDGTARGTLTVTSGKGTLRYEVVPNDPGEQLLDFAVAGLPVTISQGETVFFTGTAPVAPGA